MSYDYLIMPRNCDHLIRAERLAIGPDFLTLYSVASPTERMTSPINGVATVQLRINGVLVPKNHPDYAWDVEFDEFSVGPDWKSKIKFKRYVRLRNVIIEATYTTIAAYCHKCGGTKMVSDFQVAQNGALQQATKRTKLVQKALKFLLTSRCAFYPGLTSQLREFIGRKYGKTLTTEDISFECMRALDNMKRVQELQIKYQRLDAEEILRSVDGVSTTRDENDPTVLRTSIAVSSPTGSRDEVNIGLRVTA